LPRKALCEAQGSDLPTDDEMMRGIKREGKARKLEKKKKRNIPPDEKLDHVSSNPRLCYSTSLEKPCLYHIQSFLCDSGSDCHLTTSFTFLKTALLLRFLLILAQSNFHMLPWGIKLFLLSSERK